MNDIGVEESNPIMNKMLPAVAEKALFEDLAKSGLAPEDVGAYLAQPSELEAVGIRQHMMLQSPGSDQLTSPGYVIPYYDMYGKRVPFYRVKIFNPASKGAKYLQPSGAGTYIYFPKNFSTILKKTIDGKSRSCINGFAPALLICEGEKKAARATKEGFLCAGLGGVYNWKSRTVLLPDGSKLEKDDRTGRVRVRLPSTNADAEEPDEISTRFSILATGLKDLIDLAFSRKWQIIIAFDSDSQYKVQVQKAAASLGFELKNRGLPTNHIRQLVLPGGSDDKVGLDDFLQDNGSEALTELLHDTCEERCAFPRHPNLVEHIGSNLLGKTGRDKMRELSLSIVADLDSRGIRMKDASSDTPYYFDMETKRLMRVYMMHNGGEPLHETSFGEFLYRTYGISHADSKLIPWLAASFTGEEPIERVHPRSIIAHTDKGEVCLQLNDGQMAVVSAKGISIRENSYAGILFKSDQVEFIDGKEVLQHVKKQAEVPLQNWWFDALKSFKFHHDNYRTIASLLFYMSPWFLRWKGTQLPIELMIGEPGSGKSSLYALRMAILTGRPVLRNQPTDVRDWHASITSQDGLHVVDNVHFVSKELRQRLSDEMCRIVTEPNPFVEMRRLYSTADNMRIPVRTTFAITAITQPFISADILQRSVIFELQAVGTEHDSDWVGHNLGRFGGRAAWVAHHLLVVHKFLKLAEEKWDSRYKSDHRLANFEQLLSLLSQVLGVVKADELKRNLVRTIEDSVSEYDWTMEGLKEFANEVGQSFKAKGKTFMFTLNDVAIWAAARDDFQENTILTNARRLSRYFKSHNTMISKAVNMVEHGTQANRTVYRIGQ
jgi:hypothetical protein